MFIPFMAIEYDMDDDGSINLYFLFLKDHLISYLINDFHYQ